MRLKLTYARVTTALAATLALGGVGAALAGGGSAGSVDGTRVKRFNFAADAGDPGKTVLKAGDLSMRATCDGGGDLSAEVRTSSNNASYHSYGYSTDDSVYDFDEGSPEELSTGGERDGVYQPAHGDSVRIQYLALEDAQKDCVIAGFAFIGDGPAGSGSAGSVGGTDFKTIDYAAQEGSSRKTVLTAGGLRIRARCDSGPALVVDAVTGSDNAAYTDYPNGESFADFDTGEVSQFDPNYEQDVVYRSAGGHTVAVQFMGTDEAKPDDCIVRGIAWVK
jgi:hypothetical protein